MMLHKNGKKMYGLFGTQVLQGWNKMYKSCVTYMKSVEPTIYRMGHQSQSPEDASDIR